MATSVWLCSNDRKEVGGNPSESVCRLDILTSIASAGCLHIVVRILRLLDSPSLLASSLVCSSWQRLSLCNVYSDRKFRRKVRESVFGQGSRKISSVTFSLDMNRTSIIDATVDDDLNVFALAMSVITGRTHVMSCSLFTGGRRRWIHRFTDNGFLPGSLTCIAAGHKLVALGCRDGKIRVYESSQQFKSLRLIAILAHHIKIIHKIIFFAESNVIISCSDDMTIGITTILPDGSILLTKILHGHVSRVRAVDAEGDKVLSGSDDRSVKLWNLKNDEDDIFERPLMTMTGHSGPITGVQLSYPWALSSSGCTVRLWNAENGTCHRLLRHDNSPVSAFARMSTFRAVATVDGDGVFRCFNIDQDGDTAEQEILDPSNILPLTVKSQYQQRSPKMSNIPKFNSKRDMYSPWVDDAVFKIESIPHHITALSINNSSKLPSLTVHCLDFIQ